MSSRRALKAAEAIREVVSTAILLELRDPRVKNVTVTRVEVSGDMRNAKVFVSVMGDEAQEKLSLHGLKNSAGYLQQRVGDRIDTRYIPRLAFAIDQGVKNSLKVAEILEEVRRESQTAPDVTQESDAQNSDVKDGGNQSTEDVPQTDTEQS